jgi:hypothetical protein
LKLKIAESRPLRAIFNLAEARPAAWPFYLAAIFFLMLAALGMLDHAELIDEPFYIPLASEYAQSGYLKPIQGSMKAVSTIGPSYYISLKLWMEIAGREIEPFRLFSTFCMIAAAGIWFLIGRRMGIKSSGVHMLTLLVMPHLAITSFCVMAETYTLVNILLFLYCWLIANDALASGRLTMARNIFLLSGLPLAMAANAKPPCIVYAAAFAIIGLVRVKNVWAIAGPVLAIVLQMPFWVMWGSIFPPAALALSDLSRQAIAYPDTAVHLISIAGLMLWPALKWKWNRFTAFQLITGVIVWIIFEPDLRPNGPVFYRFLGPLMQAYALIPALKWLYLIAFLAAWKLLWDLAVEMLCNRLEITQQALLAGVFLFLGGIMKSPLAFDRYAAFFLPYLYLVVAGTLEKRAWPRAIALSGWVVLTALMIGRML